MSEEVSAEGFHGPHPSPEECFKAHFERIVSFVMSRRDFQKMDAEDAVKNALRELLPAWDTLPNPVAYWYRRSLWRADDALQNKRMHPVDSFDEAAESMRKLAAPGRSPEEEAVFQEERLLLAEVRRGLKDRDQEHLDMMLAGWTPAEMAGALDVTPVNERVARHRLMKKIARAMNPDWRGESE
ncbi:sigma-70 family RNA polymerase sigma factor (plasmid) [Streptomyces sp. DSM 116496]|uniref:sigma-70 family RNA polymerase sigma factor n=1 Tax=Streptomyces stoeckheimensis TaxID=3344656 RepID=UPI0038B40F41